MNNDFHSQLMESARLKAEEDAAKKNYVAPFADENSKYANKDTLEMIGDVFAMMEEIKARAARRFGDGESYTESQVPEYVNICDQISGLTVAARYEHMQSEDSPNV